MLKTTTSTTTCSCGATVNARVTFLTGNWRGLKNRFHAYYVVVGYENKVATHCLPCAQTVAATKSAAYETRKTR